MEFLDYDLVKTKMNELNKIFSDYDKILTDINTSIDDSINNGEESAILSTLLGESFLTQWDATATSFKSFKDMFDNTYSDVGLVTENNADLEDSATALFYGTDSAVVKPTGGTGGLHAGGGNNGIRAVAMEK